MRQQAVERITMIQQQRGQWHDKLIKKKEFQVGDWALLFDSKFKDYKAKFTIIGWVLMKSLKSLRMDQSNSLQ